MFLPLAIKRLFDFFKQGIRKLQSLRKIKQLVVFYLINRTCFIENRICLQHLTLNVKLKRQDEIRSILMFSSSFSFLEPNHNFLFKTL